MHFYSLGPGPVSTVHVNSGETLHRRRTLAKAGEERRGSK